MTTTEELVPYATAIKLCYQPRYDILQGTNFTTLAFQIPGVLCRGGKYDIKKLSQVLELILKFYRTNDEELPTPDQLNALLSAVPKPPSPAQEPVKTVAAARNKVKPQAESGKAAPSAPTTPTPTVDTNQVAAPDPEPTTATHRKDMGAYTAIKIPLNPAERIFENYPQELKKGIAYFINYNKVPIKDKEVAQLLPIHSVLEDTHKEGHRYCTAWKNGEILRDLPAAVADLRNIQAKYAAKYPEEKEKCARFGVGLISKKYPKLLFFEWDDVFVHQDENGQILPKGAKGGTIIREDDGTQYILNNAFGQIEFYQYCVEKGYHVAKSFSGNMHYVMYLPECFNDLPPELLEKGKDNGFKWLDGKKEGDFEISNNHYSQWNETGYTLNAGCIIPADDEVAIKFVRDRMERALQRTRATGKSKGAAQASGSAALRQVVPTTTNTTVDTVLVEKLRKVTTGKLGRFMHNMDIEPGRLECDLSAELQSMFNLLVMQGVRNYETCYAIFEGSALHRVYVERGDSKEKLNEQKLRRTFDTAVRDVATRVFRAYKNNDGETRKEIVRAIARFNDLEDNAIYYSDVYGRLVKLLDDGRVIIIDEHDLKCELTTSEFVWIDDNGKPTMPTVTAIKSCVNVANLPQIYYRTSGGWVTREGDIIYTKGYHDGFYLDRDIEVRPIPVDITYEHLHQAREILERAFKDVKYKSKDGLEDTVYALIATFLHPSIKKALPAIIWNKNKAGIGGSTAVAIFLQLRHNVPTNEPVALPETEKGTQEVMTAELSTHTCGFANFDNLTTTKSLGVPGLMLHFGDGMYKDRMKYGRNTTAIDTKKDVVYNGNNIIIAADFCRRVLEIELYWEKDTSTITFGKDGKTAVEVYEDTLQFAATKHNEILWAVAVAVNAWIRNGRKYPKVVPTGNWSEYNAYHKIVGGAMDMLGYTRYLQHLDKTQLVDNYALMLYKERIETLHQAFLMGGEGQKLMDGTVEYETRDFCAADLYAAMHPTRVDTADLALRLRQYDEKGIDDRTRLSIPSSFYQQDLIRLFGDNKGKSLTTILQGMVKEGIVTGCRYCLIEVDKTTNGYKWFRVMTVAQHQRQQEQEKKNNTNQAVE